MQQEDKGLLLLKHYSNLQRLSAEQLKAIKEEQLDLVTHLVAQKKIIIDSIVALQTEFDINCCLPEMKERLKMLMDQISNYENESRKLLNDGCVYIGKQMLAGRKELSIQQTYEGFSFQEHGAMLNIKR